MIADEDTVLDIVQDSYIKGFQSLNQLDSPENFRAWMKRIATNKTKDYLKKKKPILFTDMANEDGEEIDFRDDRLDHCPEEVLDRKETARLMQDILATLSEDQRLVIGMFYYEEMSVREIAETLGCSENTVKSRLNYGRKKVEVKVKELEKRGTKLYSLAPLPFLLWLFRMDAQAAEIPSATVLEAVTSTYAAAGTTVGSAGTAVAANTGVKTAVGTGAKALATKIIAGVLAVTVVGDGAADTSYTYHRVDGCTLEEVPSSSAAETTDISWILLENTQSEQAAAENTEDSAPDISGLTGLYVGAWDGSSIGVSITPKDSNTLIAGFSNTFSNDELKYDVIYENGFWKLWIGDYLMIFDFTFQEGYLLIEGSAPPELVDYLGVFQKLD